MARGRQTELSQKQSNKCIVETLLLVTKYEGELLRAGGKKSR